MHDRNENNTRATASRPTAWRALVPAVLALVAIPGCAAPTEPVDDSSVDADVALARMQESAAFLGRAEDLPTEDELLIPKVGCNSQYCERTFNHSSARNTEFAVGQYACVLSKVYGNYGGTGEAIVSAGSTHWRAEGKGSMICVPYSKYKFGSGGWAGASSAFRLSRSSDGRSTRSTWWGDAITFVTGVRGEMEGRDDEVFIKQSTSATRASVEYLDWYSDPSGYLNGYATSIFAGMPGNARTRLWGVSPQGHWTTGDTTSTGTFEFSVSVPSGYSSAYMAPTTEALCGFTRVAGDFDDNNERVQIYEYTGTSPTRWRLTAKESGASSAAAKARCHNYDQNVWLVAPK